MGREDVLSGCLEKMKDERYVFTKSELKDLEDKKYYIGVLWASLVLFDFGVISFLI